jgi:hypothetical protein
MTVDQTPAPAPAPEPEPRWDVPYPLGQSAAIESMGSVSAPLLAGISIALATLVLSAQTSFAHPNLALFLLIAATLALLGAVQCTFWARRFLVTPAELTDWWGSDLKHQDRLEAVEEEQRNLKQDHEKWARRAARYYNLGIVAFLAAVPVLLVPVGGLTHGTVARLGGFALAVAGLLGELLWIAETERRYISRLFYSAVTRRPRRPGTTGRTRGV